MLTCAADVTKLICDGHYSGRDKRDKNTTMVYICRNKVPRPRPAVIIHDLCIGIHDMTGKCPPRSPNAVSRHAQTLVGSALQSHETLTKATRDQVSFDGDDQQ